MEGILDGWLKLLADFGVLLDGLEHGYEGTIHALGEYTDDTVQSLVPAYATAVAVCKQVKIPGEFDCNAERIKLRDSALSSLVEAVGLRPAIESLLRQYHRIPSEVRDFARSIGTSTEAAKMLLTQPSLAKLQDFGVALVGNLKSWYGGIWSLALKGGAIIGDVTNWLGSVGSKSAAVVATLLSEAGGALAAVASDLLGTGLDVVEDAGQALAAIAALSGGAVKDIGGVIVDAGGAIISGVSDVGGAIVSGAGDVVDTGAGVVEDVIDWVF